MLNLIKRLIYRDALRHGLWRDEDTLLDGAQMVCAEAVELAQEAAKGSVSDGTYEAVGVHFQGNPYGAKTDFILRHGKKPAVMERTFEGIREWLETHEEEGLVFWLDGEPRCKIKRTDYGLEWPIRRGKC